MKKSKLKPLPAQNTLNELLIYDSNSGLLYWRERKDKKGWNSRFSGKEAFTHINLHGYKEGAIFNVVYRAHRVIYKMVHGYDPNIIDHINQIRHDNRIENLRNADKVVNAINSKVIITNSSGAKGVSWFKQSNKWRAYITVSDKHMHLGLFDNINDAIKVRDRAEKEYMAASIQSFSLCCPTASNP